MIVTTTNRRHAPSGTVLNVAGEVDTCAADDLRRHLDHLPAEPDDVVLVDLSAVTFMSCAALSTLAEAQIRLGPRFVVGARSRIVHRLLELTGLTPFFARRVGNAAGSPPDGTPGTVAGNPLGTDGSSSRTWTFSRTDVDRVRSLLMAVHDCDAEEAWHMLARAAARHGVPVGELAQLLIRAHREAPSPAAAEAALTVLVRKPVQPAPPGTVRSFRPTGGPDRRADRLMSI
jgi:anti-anti-sigma factor